MSRWLVPLVLLSGCFDFSALRLRDDSNGAMPEFKNVARSANENGDQTMLVMPRPASLAAGDLMIMGAYIDDTGMVNPTITPPAGWNPVALHYDSFSSYNCGWYWRTATANEDPSWQFTINPGRRVEGAIAVYSGARGFNPAPAIEFHNNAVVSASSITTVEPNTRVGWVFVADHYAVSPIDWRTAPPGTTKRIDMGHIGIFDAPMAQPGPTPVFMSSDATHVIGVEVTAFAIVP